MGRSSPPRRPCRPLLIWACGGGHEPRRGTGAAGRARPAASVPAGPLPSSGLSACAASTRPPPDWVRWIVDRARESCQPADPRPFLPSCRRPSRGIRRASAPRHCSLSSATSTPPRTSPEYAAKPAEHPGAALAAGAPGLAAELADAVTAVDTRCNQHAVVTARAPARRAPRPAHQGGGPVHDAAGRWKQFEVPWEQAQALLGHGRCLLALRKPAEAREPLHTARDIFTTLGARPARTDVDRLLAQATAATA